MTDAMLFIVLFVILVVLLMILFVLMEMALHRGRGQDVAAEMKRIRAENLNRILALFGKYEVLTNMIIRRELGLDDRVVVDCMDELERADKVTQVGRVGHAVHYRKTH